jgi:hypothetical protein
MKDGGYLGEREMACGGKVKMKDGGKVGHDARSVDDMDDEEIVNMFHAASKRSKGMK